MVDVLPGLIDKQDNFEIVRDQIALILLTEQTNQIALATTDGKSDPQEWALRIFTERFNPIEEFLTGTDYRPVINVWFDSSNYDKRSSANVDRLTSETTINIDIYGAANSAPDGSGGQIPGDKQAALTAQRAFRLVRNILMSSLNNYLQLRGLVWARWVSSVTQFQPNLGENATPQVIGIRLALDIKFNETTEIRPTGTVDEVFVDVFRSEDGEILFEADFVFPI